MPNYICVTCGAQYPESESEPESCAICTDDRQYIGWNGQQWTTIEALRADHHNVIKEVEPGLTHIITEPSFAIGQCARLIHTPGGNVMWECISYIDDATVEAVQKLGGISAIAISHPHFYSSMAEWSRAFGDIPIYLHWDNRKWVTRSSPQLHFWSGETHEWGRGSGLTLIRCGGHFPGSTVLHWRDGAEGHGALLTGDTIYVVSDRNWVSFMYSYPNVIPLNARAVNRIVDAVSPYEFDRVYSSWPERVVQSDGKTAVLRSRDRYLKAIAD